MMSGIDRTVSGTGFDIGLPGRRRVRMATAMAALLILGACASSPGLDWDLRSLGDTSDAALSATANRPSPDQRGVISYPDYQVAVAQRGDTVTSVAARLGIGAAELASLNALKPTDPLRAGEVLVLPTRVAGGTVPGSSVGAVVGGGGTIDVTSIATTALDRVGPSTPPAAAPSGNGPLRHKVLRGETAFTIARTYNVSAKALADWNGLGPDLAVREGQTLLIPTVTTAAPNPEPQPTAPGLGSPTPVPPSASKPLPDEDVAAANTVPEGKPASPDLGESRTAASSSRLGSPADGNILRGYSKGKNDGIDIAAAAGAPVRAAAEGTVAAITKDTQQVPIVVIRHADNLLTVYAGVDKLSVKKGDKVSRGQQIAAIRAGNPSFLHFEVRRGVDSLDPTEFLK
jgi:murein DD-endopeptidase MepM/ murein hydrolase activator NlpD